MIGLSAADLDPFDQPLTATGLARLVVIAFSVVATQAYVIDPAGQPFEHLDLPLAVAAGLVLANPARSAAIGLVFGLMVDAFGQRLFGLHCVAYATLGPILRAGPGPAGRWGARAWVGGVQGLAVTSIVLIGQSLGAGAVAPAAQVGGRLAQTTLWTAALAGPVVHLVESARPARR